MAAFLSHLPDAPASLAAWQPDALAAMDAHHLAAWSLSPERRRRFASSLQQFIGAQRDTDVAVLHGRTIGSLDAFCDQLEHLLPGPTLRRRVDGPGGVADLLRSRQEFLGRAAARFRYLVWTDADTLLERDPGLFAELADAMFGVAAEHEFVSTDLLLIQRTAFVGGPALRDAAAAGGPLRRWRDAGSGQPFWQVVTGLDAPPLRRLAIDDVDLV